VVDNLYGRFCRLLERVGARRLAAAGGGLALLLELPTLTSGFVSDDHVQWAMVQDSSRAPWDLFSFHTSRPETAELIRVGEIPWFIDPEIHQAFFRPLASVGHYVDYRFFKAFPWVCHAHSLAWLVALLSVVTWLFRRFEEGKWTAGLAAAVYACSPPLALSSTWLAGRNVLIATAFGMAALGMHHAYRQGQASARWPAVALFLLSLMGGECSAGPLLYLLAYAAIFDRGSGRSRAASVAPYAVLAVLFWGGTFLFGYGVRSYGFYFDPRADILRQVPVLLDRCWRLFLYEFGWGHYEVLRALPFSPIPYWSILPAVGFGVALAIGALNDRALRFWFLGAMASTIPFCLTLAQPRLLAAAHVGYSMAFVRLFATMASRVGPRSIRHFVASSLLLAALASSITAGAACLSVTVKVVHLLSIGEIESAKVFSEFAGKDAIVYSGNWLLSHTILLVQRGQGLPKSRSVAFLCGVSKFEMDRPDSRTLVIRSPSGVIGSYATILLSGPIPVGASVRFNRGVLEVLATDPALGPTEVRYDFDAPLEDQSMAWFVTMPSLVFAPAGPPEIGTRTIVWDRGYRVVPL
jgi:hypothetical protein